MRILGLKPAVLCYVHVSPSVELLGPTIPSVFSPLHTPFSNQIDAPGRYFHNMALYPRGLHTDHVYDAKDSNYGVIWVK